MKKAPDIHTQNVLEKNATMSAKVEAALVQMAEEGAQTSGKGRHGR